MLSPKRLLNFTFPLTTVYRLMGNSPISVETRLTGWEDLYRVNYREETDIFDGSNMQQVRFFAIADPGPVETLSKNTPPGAIQTWGTHLNKGSSAVVPLREWRPLR